MPILSKLLLSAATLALAAAAHAAPWRCTVTSTAPPFRFDVKPDQTPARGCTSTRSFLLSMPATDGNYLVTVELGGDSPAVTTVKAESRRLALLAVATGAGQTRRESFTVNVRLPQIAPGNDVRRKPRELTSLDWDDRLNLEFSGTQPSLRSITVERVDTPTVYLAGDSTVVDQANEPWAAWGQILPAFFAPAVTISNQAESGETIASFEGERRFQKIFSTIKSGDFLLIQFAHNDQKRGTGYVSPERYTELLHKYIAMARDKGATPILVTSMNRRTFDPAGKITDTLAPYPALTRTAAELDRVPVIDLNALSKTLYEAVGELNSKSLFVYADAHTYPNQNEDLHDDTHFSSYGAYELARTVVASIQKQQLPLVRYLRRNIPAFDPSRPDPPLTVAIPPTPSYDLQKPYER